MSGFIISRTALAGLACLIGMIPQPLFAQPDGAMSYTSWGETISADVRLEDGKTEDLKPARLSLNDLEAFIGGGTRDLMPRKSSAIETLYAERIIDELAQYGYDLFDTDVKISDKIPAGKITDSYLLSTGDALSIVLRGQENGLRRATIDSQGMLVIESFSPVMAAGKTLADIRTDLMAQAAQTHNTDIPDGAGGPDP